MREERNQSHERRAQLKKDAAAIFSTSLVECHNLIKTNADKENSLLLYSIQLNHGSVLLEEMDFLNARKSFDLAYEGFKRLQDYGEKHESTMKAYYMTGECYYKQAKRGAERNHCASDQEKHMFLKAYTIFSEVLSFMEEQHCNEDLQNEAFKLMQHMVDQRYVLIDGADML